MHPTPAIDKHIADTHIFYFWDSILHHTEDFLRMMWDTPVNMDS